MIHRVIIQRLAVEDLDQAYQWAARRAPHTATCWLQRFQATLRSLEQHPERCPVAPEARKLNIELRELLFGQRPNVFRVIFLIDGDCVRVLRIRRGQRRLLSRPELGELVEPDE
jgi:plasmid stabilization system protein ParE